MLCSSRSSLRRRRALIVEARFRSTLSSVNIQGAGGQTIPMQPPLATMYPPPPPPLLGRRKHIRISARNTIPPQGWHFCDPPPWLAAPVGTAAAAPSGTGAAALAPVAVTNPVACCCRRCWVRGGGRRGAHVGGMARRGGLAAAGHVPARVMAMPGASTHQITDHCRCGLVKRRVRSRLCPGLRSASRTLDAGCVACSSMRLRMCAGGEGDVGGSQVI